MKARICSIILLLAPACGKKSEPKAEQASGAESPVSKGSTAKSKSPAVKPQEVEFLAKTRALMQSPMPAISERQKAIRMDGCVDAGSLEEAGRSFNESLRDDGWNEIRTIPAKSEGDKKRGIAAALGPDRLMLLLEQAPFPDCSDAGAKVKVRLEVLRDVQNERPKPRRIVPEGVAGRIDAGQE